MNGAIQLVANQAFSRLATFVLNLLVVRTVGVSAFGLFSVNLHLVQTTVLLLCREGIRKFDKIVTSPTDHCPPDLYPDSIRTVGMH